LKLPRRTFGLSMINPLWCEMRRPFVKLNFQPALYPLGRRFCFSSLRVSAAALPSFLLAGSCFLLVSFRHGRASLCLQTLVSIGLEGVFFPFWFFFLCVFRSRLIGNRKCGNLVPFFSPICLDLFFPFFFAQQSAFKGPLWFSLDLLPPKFEASVGINLLLLFVESGNYPPPFDSKVLYFFFSKKNRRIVIHFIPPSCSRTLLV